MQQVFDNIVLVGMFFREREGLPVRMLLNEWQEAGDYSSIKLRAEREPENPHDPFAVKAMYVTEGDGPDLHIAYVPRSIAAFLSNAMDQEGATATMELTDILAPAKANGHPQPEVTVTVEVPE
jgi:hypothetical protein